MPSGTRRNAYKALAVAGSSALLLGTISLLSPSTLGAFFPFAITHAADGDTPLLHDPSLNLLEAAINSDPNPTKGDTLLSLSEGSALMNTSGPDGTIPAGTAAENPSVGAISVYTVKNGDSISGIADHFGVSVNTILWANDLTTKSTIKPGMSLVILPVSGTRHTVAEGETLSSIATKFHASTSEIATFNGLDTDATVVVGSTLIIPGGEAANTTAPAPAKKSSAASKPAATSAKKTTSKSTTKTGKDIGAASAGSGYYENPVPGAILYQGIHGNNGVDLSAPSGTPIHAAADGTVIISKADGGWNGGYGSYVVVSHANGTQTLYAHMSKDIATVGETVSKGELLGYVGETGEATGNHLHFEVRGAKNPFGYSCTLMKKCY
ncbi:MAG: LysM peptidoglycan-binding domain-containing M23 family metallopeptidase [Patescibacteria group bacterium]